MNRKEKNWLKILFFSEEEFPWYRELASEIVTELNKLMTEAIRETTEYWIEEDVTPDLQEKLAPLISEKLYQDWCFHREQLFNVPWDHVSKQLSNKIFRMFEGGPKLRAVK